MAIEGISGASRVPETMAVAQVAANPYQNTAVRPEVSGQAVGPRQLANENYLERKISERQTQRAQEAAESRDRLEISQEAKDAWQTGSYKAKLENRQSFVRVQQEQENSNAQETKLRVEYQQNKASEQARPGAQLNLVM